MATENWTDWAWKENAGWRNLKDFESILGQGTITLKGTKMLLNTNQTN